MTVYGPRVKRTTMNRFQFVAGPHVGDKARTRPIYLKDGRRLLGHVFLPDGPGLGYKFRLLGRTHASKLRYRTITLACLAMGEIL